MRISDWSSDVCSSDLTGAELLFELISQRYERGATLITSNLPFDEWTETLWSERLTGALLDRITHHVNILEMNGESYRLAQSRRSEEHTSELQSLMRISYAVFCLKQKTTNPTPSNTTLSSTTPWKTPHNCRLTVGQ